MRSCEFALLLFALADRPTSPTDTLVWRLLHIATMVLRGRSVFEKRRHGGACGTLYLVGFRLSGRWPCLKCERAQARVGRHQCERKLATSRPGARGSLRAARIVCTARGSQAATAASAPPTVAWTAGAFLLRTLRRGRSIFCCCGRALSGIARVSL